MRILCEDDNKIVNRALILLTDSLGLLLEGSSQRHEHIPSEDYRKEITICIYDMPSFENLDERSRTLVTADE